MIGLAVEGGGVDANAGAHRAADVNGSDELSLEAHQKTYNEDEKDFLVRALPDGVRPK